MYSAGAFGPCVSHGSITITFPAGDSILQLAWPSQSSLVLPCANAADALDSRTANASTTLSIDEVFMLPPLVAADYPRIGPALNAETVRAMNLPDVKDKMAAQGLFVVAGTAEEFSTYLKAEISKWATVVKDSGAKAD